MNKLNNKSGFTLIEIIVVLIIVGILAAIALPNLFSNIQKSKGAEAVASFGPMKASLEGCGQKNSTSGSPNYSGCTLPSTQVGANNGSNFWYTLGTSAGNCSGTSTTGAGDATGYCIYASYSTTGTSGINYVTFLRNSSGTVCTGYGSFSGIC